ncbi:helix-turn-helix transcriptional regulator [Micromonospora sp. NPDC005087]|uniref:helix-turn-helix transcriptional regulator n=1 Tax=Micromonospora sp. NPDC005087 TaxID=3364225 RepID=UPI0036AB59EE
MATESEQPAGPRLRVLRVLNAAIAPLSIVAIAGQLGVHPNTVRFHLDTLVGQGRVERVVPEQNRPGRPPLLFRAVRRMDPAGPRQYRVLAEILALSLAGDADPDAKAIEAGRRWGRQIASSTDDDGAGGKAAPVDHLMSLLETMNFAPERRDADGQVRIGLRHCPFLELAESQPHVVCPVHLGLMRGAMDAWQVPVMVDRLEPFVEPNLCLTHLTVTGAAR